MSKLEDILKFAEPNSWESEQKKAKQQIKDLIQTLVDETFDKDDPKAYEFWQKVQAL